MVSHRVQTSESFNIPISILMDVKGMAQTAAALFKGLAEFMQDIAIAEFVLIAVEVNGMLI